MSAQLAVIFGGSGFVGIHFAHFLVAKAGFSKVLICDMKEPDFQSCGLVISSLSSSEKIEYVSIDVRQPDIQISLSGEIALIANFAAIHREPGHALNEYYDTNIPGAENVCAFAESVGCNSIIFTSSIAPYGPTEEEKTESSRPHPVSGYGGSKLAAEHIHRTWQARDAKNRKLVIVRPGVVFGTGEGGNVTRLLRAYLKGYFFYMGNKQTRKAGTYVKELCNAMMWVLENKCDNGVALFNMSMNPGPTVEEYVEVIKEVSGVDKFVPSVPFWALYAASLVIDPLSRLFGINQPISPVRLKKLVKSNNIIPQFLADNHYEYLYSFKEAMEDWKKDKPSDWE